MPGRREIPLRWADLDLLGHVNNVRLMEVLQEARVFLAHDLAEAAGIDDPQALRDGFSQVIARLEVDFRKPADLRDGHLIVESWVERIGTTSYTVQHRVTNPSGDDVMIAKSVMVCFDAVEARPKPLPDGWRAVLMSASPPADQGGS